MKRRNSNSSSDSSSSGSSSSSYYSSDEESAKKIPKLSAVPAPQQEEEDDDDYGPAMPSFVSTTEEASEKVQQDDDEDYGPSIPTISNDESNQVENGDKQQEAEPQQKPLTKEEKLDQLHLQQLPEGFMYEWSYMHRDFVTYTLVAPLCASTSSQGASHFIVTMSKDGHVKFWRKTVDNIEFVKHFISHKCDVMGPLKYGCMSHDGSLCSSMTRADLKIYDVTNFDMVNVLSFSKNGDVNSSDPSTKRELRMCEYVTRKQGSAKDILLGVFFEDGSIEFYNPLDPDAPYNPPLHQYNNPKGPKGTVMIHRSPITCCKFNSTFGVMISCDEKGMIEYWNPNTGKFPTLEDSSSYLNSSHNGFFTFKYKSETSLFELAKLKTYAISMDISKDGKKFTLMCRDGHIRVFSFLSGKLLKDYDETLAFQENLQKAATNTSFLENLKQQATLEETNEEITKAKELYQKLQQETTDIEMYALENFDFGRRVAIEHEIEQLIDSKHSSKQSINPIHKDYHCVPSVLFDESGNFLMYPTLFGIKFRNMRTDHVERLLGKVESTERFLNISLFQGIVKISRAELSKYAAARKSIEGSSQMFTMMSSEDAVAPQMDYNDPTLFASAYKKNRFYLFTKREPSEDEELTGLVHRRFAYITSSTSVGRDIFNEKPSKEEMEIANAIGDSSVGGSGLGKKKSGRLGKVATIHTTFGDIQVRLFPDACPKTVENFTQLSLNGYYENCIFHRVIKNFMIQTGDSENRDGTGGTSIYGKEFEDEFSPSLRHDRPGKLSMANRGPGTNGSQFFITTVPTPWLNDKHTLFGEVIRGMEVVHAIENVPTDEHERPVKSVNPNVTTANPSKNSKNLLDINIINIDIDEFY